MYLSIHIFQDNLYIQSYYILHILHCLLLDMAVVARNDEVIPHRTDDWKTAHAQMYGPKLIVILSNTHMIKCHTSCCCLVSSLPLSSLAALSMFVVALIRLLRSLRKQDADRLREESSPLLTLGLGYLRKLMNLNLLCRMLAILRVSDILQSNQKQKGFQTFKSLTIGNIIG